MKHIYPLFLIAAFAVILFFAPAAHAQVAITGSDEALSCLITSNNSDISGVSSAAPVGVIISPDNNIYSIRGTYSLNISCGDLDEATCNILDGAVAGAVTNGNNISNFPQNVAQGASNNTLNIVVGHFQGKPCGATEDTCESNVFIPSANGGGPVKATIYIDESVTKDATGGSPTLTTILSEPNVLQSVITHEMGHAFGLDDTNTFSSEYSGIMGNGLQAAYNNPNNPPLTWDDSTVAVIQALNTLNSIALNNPNCVSDLAAECVAPDVQGFFQGEDGFYHTACLTPTADSNICYESVDETATCDCANGYTQEGDSCVEATNTSTPTGGYDCNSDGACVYNPDGGLYTDSTCNDACMPVDCTSNPYDPACNN